jgi:hypothetical protein
MKKGITFVTRAVLQFCLMAVILVFTTSATQHDPNENFVKAARFKVYKGLSTFFSNDFDFDVQCGVTKFEVIYQTRGMDPIVMQNSGAKFNPQVAQLIHAAKPGDTYIFRKVCARCQGDAANRRLSTIVVNIR